MKDPLQKEQTPYELLSLTREATDREIDAAFKLGLTRRGNVQKLTAAKRTLQDPVERALLDIFHYYPEALSRLSPNPQGDDALELSRRAVTAQSWEQGLKASFPDTGAAHSLSVLWYWWALAEEERLIQGGGAGANGNSGGAAPVFPVDQMWERAIAYWAMLITSADFWTGLAKLPADVASPVQAILVNRLNHKFHDLSQSYRSKGAMEAAARYQELELALATEIRTAKQVMKAGLNTRRGKLACGPLLLRRFGLLDTVKRQIARGLEGNPASKNLLALREALSDYSSVSVLLENNKPQAALSALEALPTAERESAEAICLRARALFELGKQQASLNQLDEALCSWGEALETLRRTGGQAGTEAKITAEVVSACCTRAAAMQRRRRDDAMALLEKGLAVVADERIRLTLADLLTQRAINTINDAQEKEEKNGGGSGEELRAAVKRGLDDLERATAMGDQRAAEQVEVARKMYAELTSETRAVMRQANEAAAREDWDKAIFILRDALKGASPSAREKINTNLAVCVANRAIDKCDRAIEMFESAKAAQEQIFEKLEASARRFSSDCALCGKVKYYSGGNWYSFSLANSGTAHVCGTCILLVQRATDAASAPNPQALDLLRSSHSDLKEAARLDPSSEFVQTNLSSVEQILKSVAPKSHTSAAKPTTSNPPPPSLTPSPSSGALTLLRLIVNWWWFLISAALFFFGSSGWRSLGVFGLVVFLACAVIYFVMKRD
jgi:tetratricopeptide (TPR) repeat protein